MKALDLIFDQISNRGEQKIRLKNEYGEEKQERELPLGTFENGSKGFSVSSPLNPGGGVPE